MDANSDEVDQVVRKALDLADALAALVVKAANPAFEQLGEKARKAVLDSIQGATPSPKKGSKDSKVTESARARFNAELERARARSGEREREERERDRALDDTRRVAVPSPSNGASKRDEIVKAIRGGASPEELAKMFPGHERSFGAIRAHLTRGTYGKKR